MAKKNDKRGLSGRTAVVNIFYDGEKYKEPVFVGINGMTWLIQRGVDVEVPEEVAEVLRHEIEQDKNTASMIRLLSSADQDNGVM